MWYGWPFSRQLADYWDYVTVWCQVEASLQHVMPFGWQREWVQGEQANQDDEGEYLYRRRDAKGESAIDSSLLQTHRGNECSTDRTKETSYCCLHVVLS